MRIALASMTRPALLAGLIATASAVGLSRLAPEPRSERIARPATHILISPHGVDPGAPGTLWLDKETGRTVVVPEPTGRVVQHASVSPWIDESGRSQMVGRFAVRPDDPSPEAVGLVRATFPEGRVLDLVATEILPVGRPCWYPGTRASVLFAGGDGALYRHDFEPSSPGLGMAAESGPRPIAWRCPKPGLGAVWLSEPFLATDPRLARTLVVGLRFTRALTARRGVSPSRLWWLRLSADGEAIEEAGPLDPDSNDEESDIRSPVVGRTPEGSPALAYFSSNDCVDWDLRTARLMIDGAGRPSVESGSSRKLAGRCRSSLGPGFSGDGRWISAVQLDSSGRGTILRLDLADPASADPSTVASPRPAHVGKWSLLVTAIESLLGAEAHP